jgi:dihydroorotase
VLPATAAQFARAIVMPNLRPPVTTAAAAAAYRERIVAALPQGVDFTPLMTLYLTDKLPPDEIRRAKEAGVVAVKLYPAGATTNSDAGVTDIRKTYATLEAMQREGLLLLVHGEVTDSEIDVFDREAVFIERVMQPLRRDFPELKLVFEHITTQEAAQYVIASDRHTAATITAHHLLYNRNAIFKGGLRPHYYCLPVLKREVHRQALAAAATSGSSKFFLGTDSAPHAAVLKENSVCGAGCYTALTAMELYAEAFEAAGALDKLEAFASFNGADFYGLPRNRGTVVLKREAWTLPESVPFGDATLKPLRGGEVLQWKLT